MFSAQSMAARYTAGFHSGEEEEEEEKIKRGRRKPTSECLWC
jgi:hypothetical protein